MNYNLLARWWRYRMSWFPVQFRTVCGAPYWGGWPRWEVRRRVQYYEYDHATGKVLIGDAEVTIDRTGRWVWLPWMQDYCSRHCANVDLGIVSGRAS